VHALTRATPWAGVWPTVSISKKYGSAPPARRSSTQSTEYSLSRVSPCYVSVRSVSPSVQVVPCRFLPYAAGRDCDTCRLSDRQSRLHEVGVGGSTCGLWGGTGDVLHCQPSSMTFAVVVVPLPLLPARGSALCRRQVRSGHHRHVVMSSIRGPIFFYRWHGTWSG
jgi:hypothetical protein